jgi:hypothetical protein
MYVLVLVTVTGWYRTKRPMHCGHFSSIVLQIRLLIITYSSLEFLDPVEVNT